MRRATHQVYFGCNAGQSPLPLASETKPPVSSKVCSSMTSARWPHQASGCCQQKWRIIPALRQLLHYKSWTRGEGHVPMAYPCALPKEVILGKAFLRRNICSYDRTVASNSMQTTTTNRMKKQKKVYKCFLEGKYLGHFFVGGPQHLHIGYWWTYRDGKDAKLWSLILRRSWFIWAGVPVAKSPSICL